MLKKIIVATRSSKLAYSQTKQTVEILQKLNPEYNFEIKKITTKGDKDRTTPLTEFGGTGLFVKELENALLNNEADIAIHSLKDVPTKIPENLELTAFPKREKPNDLLLTKNGETLSELKTNPIIGTGSLRRRLQISILRPDAKFVELRGNIDSRIEKLKTGNYDAIVLAAAGLNRLGIKYPKSAILDSETFIPSFGQGSLAIECRKNDNEIKKLVMKINDLNTEIAVKVERAIMKEIEGGCKFPLAAFATVKDGMVHFSIIAGDYSTGKYVKLSQTSTIQDSINDSIALSKKVKYECQKQNINISCE